MSPEFQNSLPEGFTDLYGALVGHPFSHPKTEEGISTAVVEMRRCAEILVADYKAERRLNSKLRAQLQEEPLRYDTTPKDNKRQDLGSLCVGLSEELDGILDIYDAFASIQNNNPFIDTAQTFQNYSVGLKGTEGLIKFMVLFTKYIQFEKGIFNRENEDYKQRLEQLQRNESQQPPNPPFPYMGGGLI